MELMTWEFITSLTWPAAVTAIAFSPLGKASAAWLMRQSGNDATTARVASANNDRLASAMERLAESQERQASIMQQMQVALGVLLDRPRGAGGLR